eukprot:5700417-Pyramimonas_sp.AAC.1
MAFPLPPSSDACTRNIDMPCAYWSGARLRRSSASRGGDSSVGRGRRDRRPGVCVLDAGAPTGQ